MSARSWRPLLLPDFLLPWLPSNFIEFLMHQVLIRNISMDRCRCLVLVLIPSVAVQNNTLSRCVLKRITWQYLFQALYRVILRVPFFFFCRSSFYICLVVVMKKWDVQISSWDGRVSVKTTKTTWINLLKTTPFEKRENQFLSACQYCTFKEVYLIDIMLPINM